MTYHTVLLELIIIFLLLFVAGKLIKWWDKRRTLSEIRHTKPPKRYEKYLLKTPLYPRLDPEDKAEVMERLRLFIAEKEFVGIKKDVTEEMKVVIAFYAVLMALRLPRDCYHELQTVLVYPYRFVADEVKSYGGVYTKERFVMEGQSSGDVVVISWHEAKNEAYHLRHHNVIIHEFAHELDFEDGIADGVPPLERSRYYAWSHTLFPHYEKLNAISLKNRDWGDYALFGPYAATHPAEFFAVASEIFFSRPARMQEAFPDIYAQLKAFYGLDTVKLLAGESYR